MLNFGLMSRWENWATILLMVAIAVFAANAISRVVIKEKTE